MPDTDPFIRRELDALQGLLQIEISSLRRELNYRFEAIQIALSVAAHEREIKDAELNDVRHRFIPREVYEADKSDREKRQHMAASAKAVRSRATMFGFITMTLTILGLVIAVFRVLEVR